MEEPARPSRASAGFGPWLHRLTVNACLDIARKRRGRSFEVELTPLHEAPVPDPTARVADALYVERMLAAIDSACRAIGVDPAHDRIRSPPPPITRAAACRPVSTAPRHSTASTRWGRCRGPGCTAPTAGVEQPHRGIVAGTRLGRDLAWELPDRAAAATDGPEPAAALIDASHRTAVRGGDVAPRRRAPRRRLARGGGRRPRRRDRHGGDRRRATRAAFESTNLTTVARAMVAAAAARTESRGCHRRTDWSGRPSQKAGQRPTRRRSMVRFICRADGR